MILNIFLATMLLLAPVPASTPDPKSPAVDPNSYEVLIDNIKDVLKIEFKEETYKTLKFTKAGSTRTFDSLTQLEKDVFILQRAKAFSLHIRTVEQKIVDEILFLSEDDSEFGLETKERMAKMIVEIQAMKKEQTKTSIDFAKQLIKTNKISSSEAGKLLKEIHRINDSIFTNAP